jgi:hypothetical protein
MPSRRITAKLVRSTMEKILVTPGVLDFPGNLKICHTDSLNVQSE